MKRTLKVVGVLAAILALVLTAFWLAIAAEGGGPPPSYKSVVRDYVYEYREKRGKWPLNIEALMESKPEFRADSPLTYAFRTTRITFYSLSDGNLLIVFEWKQFGYSRASILMATAKQLKSLGP